MTTTTEAVTDLVLRSDQSMFDARQVAALRQLGVDPNTSNADLAIFFHHSRRTGLDPFAKQIYMISRTQTNRNGQKEVKNTIQTGIDGYRLIARKAADKTGVDFDYSPTEWCGEDGVWRDVWLGPGHPVAARITIYRGDSKQFPAVAHYSEYVQTKYNGEITAMWKKMSAGQLEKCVEAKALRKAYPLDLSGIYTDDEMQQSEDELENLGETSGEPVTAENAPKTPVQRAPRKARAKAPDPTTPAPEAHAPAAEPEDLGEKEPEPAPPEGTDEKAPEPDPVDPDAAERTDPAAPDPEDPAEPPADYGTDEAEPEDEGPAAVLEADTALEAAPTTEEAPEAAPEKPKAPAFKQCTPGQFRTMVELSKEAYPDQPSLLAFLGSWFSQYRGVKVTQIPGPGDTSRDEAEALTAHLKSLIAGELPGV